MSNLLFNVFPNENFVDLGLYQYGWEHCEPSHLFGPAVRNHYIFHYVISGTGTLMANDAHGNTQTFQIKSGQGFMLFPNQINTYIADKNLPWEYTWLEFDGLRAKEAITLSGLSLDRPVFHSRANGISKNMCDEMLYISEHADESPLHLIGHLYLFLDYLTRSSSGMILTSSNNIKDFYIKEALSYIEQNFQNNISIQEIATHCGLNRSYFGKIFKDSLNKTPQEFLIHYRMIKATELLKLSRYSITDIANAVGYTDALHFSRAFKSVYLVSPRKWRTENSRFCS